MPCDTRLKPKQTVQQRAEEIRRAVTSLDKLLTRRQAKVVVGPQGAVAFEGWSAENRNGVTDACAYRRLMAQGSALARMEIARAEALSGRKIDRQVLAQGIHSHDGGEIWHAKG